MKKLISTILFALSAGCLAVFAADAPKLLVVKNHADWCGSCKTIEPHFVGLQEKFGNKSVLFVTLDFTNKATSSQANLMAARLGLDSSLTEKPKTGIITVMNEKGEILEKFTKADSLTDMSTDLEALM